MRLSARLLTASLVALVTSCTTVGGIATDRLRIDAAVITAGPYGESWDIDIREYRDGSGAELRFGSYLGASRTINGSLIVDKQQLSTLKSLLTSQDYFNLPAEISNPMVGFHRPDFFVTACLGKRCHKVNLYDPATVGSSPEGKRFLSLWAALVEPLPLKPSWQ